jgi:hypothetical protein
MLVVIPDFDGDTVLVTDFQYEVTVVFLPEMG